ncbi:MAG: hypothetical protein JO115_05580 [Pseudonocardiales bacterium]|nr:hypothetical protein [Pseudonocardiales bacterium]
MATNSGDADQPIVVDVTPFSLQGSAALLTVRLGEELGGYARCRTMSVADAQRFAELLGTVPELTMEQVDMALRAALSM